MVPDQVIYKQVLALFKKMKLPDDVISLAKLQIQQMEENRTQGVGNERKGIRERIAKMEEQQQKLLDDRLEGLIDKDLCYRKLSQIQRNLDLANVRLKEIQDDNNANYMALNKTIDVLGDLYKLYKSSDTPTRHMYHKAFFEAIVVDEKKIIGLKWKVPFSTLYQPNSRSVLQPFGEPAGIRTQDQELKRLLLYH